MKNIAVSGAVVLALMCASLPAWGGEDAHGDGGPAWLPGIEDQKLIAVDGSSITLSPAQDKMTLAIVSPSGAEQKKVFVLMTDTLGTIADGADAAHITGFFRVTGNGLEEQFGDGHTEQLALNGAGGISLATHEAAETSCMSWYPAGHVFSEAERRAAVADYASRLGLASSSKAPHVEQCQASKAIVAQPASRTTRHVTQTASLAPIMVRNSVVHPIDAPAAVAAPLIEHAAWSAHQTAQSDAPVQPGHGASDCLSVESDGANLGFRNQCGYGVQFAYCLQAPGQNCEAGAKTGDVSANAFTPLVEGANIKASDAEHDFRWVACSGGASDVTPHLDKAEPPAGRCVRNKSS